MAILKERLRVLLGRSRSARGTLKITACTQRVIPMQMLYIIRNDSSGNQDWGHAPPPRKALT